MTTAFQIHLDEPAGGDILIFLTGQEEIEGAEAQLNRRARLLPATAGKVLVCPIFAALENAKQYEVHDRRGWVHASSAFAFTRLAC